MRGSWRSGDATSATSSVSNLRRGLRKPGGPLGSPNFFFGSEILRLEATAPSTPVLGAVFFWGRDEGTEAVPNGDDRHFLSLFGSGGAQAFEGKREQGVPTQSTLRVVHNCDQTCDSGARRSRQRFRVVVIWSRVGTSFAIHANRSAVQVDRLVEVAKQSGSSQGGFERGGQEP